MTIQAWVGVISILMWITTGIFNLISGEIMMVGLIAFMAGVWLTTWENKCVLSEDSE